MKKIIIGLVTLMLLVSGTAAAATSSSQAPANSAITPAPAKDNEAAPVIIAVFDLDKVMSESKKAMEFQEQVNKKGQELTDRLQAERPNLTEDQFKQKQEAAYTIYLATKQEGQKRLDEYLQKVLVDVAKEKKLTIILYKGIVALGGLDITDDIMKKMI